MPSTQAAAPDRSAWGLLIGAVGIVYGDIGTSPLYALRESLAGSHPLPIDARHVLAILSLMFWSLTLVVTVKYATLMMRADNRGQGGSLALLALISHRIVGSRRASVVILGIFAAALFYGDSMITPAISVLSAVEGLGVIEPGMKDYIIPVTLGILITLFLIQRHGTGAIGALFGPVMCVWFVTLAALGVAGIVREPGVLAALNPTHAIGFFFTDPWRAFLVLGSVVLTVTGAEALYADMGHFGKRPIRLAWLALVWPALVLNYFGQGAELLDDPKKIANPFYLLAPEWFRLPLILVATAATIIASQAVITGAFSVTRQAIQLGFLPRMTIIHTSKEEIGQIYVPYINWMLLVFVVALVLGFKSSSSLAWAYGVAVTGTMLIDTILLCIAMFLIWRWPAYYAIPLSALLFVVDLAFFGSNTLKIPQGGWFPIVVAIVSFVLLTTWKRGRDLVAERVRSGALPLDLFLQSSVRGRCQKVAGTAVYMTGSTEGVPLAFMHNIKHNKVIHERVLFLTVQVAEVPNVPEAERIEVQTLAHEMYRVILHYGFMDNPNVPRALSSSKRFGLTFNIMDTSFFLSRETPIPSAQPGMARWREHVYAWMARSAASAMEFFQIPPGRVVELGAQMEI